MRPLPAEPVSDRLEAEPWLDDTAAFNRWLCISRVRASVAIAIFFPALAWLDLVQLRPLPVIAACALQVAFSAAALAGARRLVASRAFLVVQMLVDIGVITAGIGFAATGGVALIARLLYVVAIVPASLISVPFGCLAAFVATLGHATLLVLEGGFHWTTFASFEFLGPTFLFAIVAQQTFVYGAHLRANAPNATFVLVAAHSSGTYVAQELIGQIARSGDASTWLGKMVYANLDGGYGLEAATARQMRRAVFVWGDDPRAGQSSNAEVMKQLGGQYGAKGKTVRVDASGSGCNRSAKWCLHDTLITTRPHNPGMYDLANDYVKFAGDRKVVTSWIDAVEADLR